MWLADKLYQKPDVLKSSIARVSFAHGNDFGALGGNEFRSVPIFAPRGISYLPCNGDNMLILNIGGNDCAVGTLCVADGLENGELMLSSAGGATIKLCNDGTILLNDQVISAKK